MIECQDVSFSYPASTLPDSERQAGGALKHISCTIEDGSFVLLCGTSGCGKTTMTRLFNGLIPHYHEGTYTGSVYLDGKDTRDLSLFDISLKVGSVFQNPRSQFFNVDTTSELAFGPENHGIAEDLVRDRVKRVAAQLKLEPLLDRSIFSLSGGEKQKIACGSAAAIDPDIYVLDEPSSNLDAYAIADFRQLLFTLKSQGKTIIISEHRLSVFLQSDWPVYHNQTEVSVFLLSVFRLLIPHRLLHYRRRFLPLQKSAGSLVIYI